MKQIVVNYIVGGTFPIDVFIADIYGNNRSLIGTIGGDVPPQVTFDITIPPLFDSANEIMLILRDVNNCEIFKILECYEPLLRVCLIFQDGIEFGTQGTPPLNIPDQVCAEQDATIYYVNIGNISEFNSCENENYVITLFSAVEGWESVISLYYDPGMNSPFDGKNLWYRSSSGVTLLQINSVGYVQNKFNCFQ